MLETSQRRTDSFYKRQKKWYKEERTAPKSSALSSPKALVPSANCQALLFWSVWLEERLFHERLFFLAYTPVWICYSRIKCPSNCLRHTENLSCERHSASSFQTFCTKCPYMCPWPPWPLLSQISDKTSEQFVIFILFYCLFYLKSL